MHAKSPLQCSLETTPAGLKCREEHASLEDRMRGTVDVQTLVRLGKPTLFAPRPESEGLKYLNEHVSLEGKSGQTSTLHDMIRPRDQSVSMSTSVW